MGHKREVNLRGSRLQQLRATLHISWMEARISETLLVRRRQSWLRRPGTARSREEAVMGGADAPG